MLHGWAAEIPVLRSAKFAEGRWEAESFGWKS